jgi:Surface-adhesin protein E
MSNAKKVQTIFCLVVLLLFIGANHSFAADWILFGQTASGDIFYDKSSMNKNGDIVSVWTQEIFNKDGKMNTYEVLKNLGKTPRNPDILSQQLILREFDCANEKMQSTSLTVYTVDGASVFSQWKSFDEWHDIPNPTLESLGKIVCGNSGLTARDHP